MKRTVTAKQEHGHKGIVNDLIIESLPDPVIAVDPSGNVLVWNKAAEVLYGWNKEEILGKKEKDVLKSRLLNATVETYRASMKKHGSWYGEVIQYKKDGARVFTLSSIVPYRNTDGKIIGTIGFNKDITQHKNNEYNLRFLSGAFKVFSSSLDYRETLTKVAHLAVPHMGDWCGVDFINEKGELESIAVVHKDPKKIKFALQLRKQYPANMNEPTGAAKVIKTGKSEFYPYVPDELIIKIAKDPKHLELLQKIGFTSIMIVPIISHKKVMGIITLVSSESRRQYTKLDLDTAEKLAERASVAIENALLYEQAEQEIAERTQVEERLREMESRKDNFISMASHELKTPVTSLKIYRDLLDRQLDANGIKDFNKILAVMDSQINKLSLLISDLLNISKIQVGKLDFRMNTFKLCDMIEETITVLQPTTNHVIDYKTDAPDVKVYGDKDRLGQVMINLITNAIKYSSDKEKLVIRVTVQDTTVRVSVRDYGIGIKKEHQQRIFERFYQVEEKDKTFPGLGMGLYISHEIITRHKGKIWAEKAQGKGSLFIFTLPIYKKT
jgi:PAS domain S-box-containing protein